jgi:hypothetical protein
MAKNGNIHPTRIFREPKDLEQAWEAYKQSLENEAKKWPKVQYVGKDGERVIDYPVLPFVKDGFYTFCRKHYGVVHHYFDNKEGYYNDFGDICRAIEVEIRAQQITGGMLNMFNPSITQRLNGLADKKEHSVAVEQPLFPEV